MTYIFEDGPDAEISRLIKLPYSGSEVDIRFSSGNINLVHTVNEALNDGVDTIAVFIDIIPGNKNTAIIYTKLVEEFSYREDVTIFIAPIICVEYYLILDLYNKGLLADKKFVDMCVDIEPLVNLIEEAKKSGRRVKTFEKQCKKVIDSYSTVCFRNTTYKGNYSTNETCRKCEKCPESVLHRSLDMLKYFPYIPIECINSEWYLPRRMNMEQYIAGHNKVIDTYNRISYKISETFIEIPLLSI